MNALVATLVTIMLTVGTTRQGVPAPDPEAERARVTTIATDIAKASQRPLFGGPRGIDATALALLTIAQTESGFWANVQDCTLCYPGSAWCDQGRSVTIYQLQGPMAWGGYTREQLCTSNSLATERAHAVLYRFRKVRTSLTLFDVYGRGGPVAMQPTKTAKNKDRVFANHLRTQGIRLGWKHNALWAE